jgi:hypothetical protein
LLISRSGRISPDRFSNSSSSGSCSETDLEIGIFARRDGNHPPAFFLAARSALSSSCSLARAGVNPGAGKSAGLAQSFPVILRKL